MGRFLAVLLILTALPFSLWAAPQVVSSRLEGTSKGTFLGQPFHWILELDRVDGLTWTTPRPGSPLGPVTLRSLTWERGNRRLILELQPFQLGRMTLEPIPIQWRSGDGQEGTLASPSLTLDVQGVPAEELRPRPPRFLLPPPPPFPLALAIGALAALLCAGGAGWWLQRAWKRRIQPVESAERVQEGVEFFENRLQELWRIYQNRLSQREMATRLLTIFREYLSWRFDADLLPLTAREAVQTISLQEDLPSDSLVRLSDLLEMGEETAFSVSGGSAAVLFSAIRASMNEFGEPPSREENDAVPSHA